MEKSRKRSAMRPPQPAQERCAEPPPPVTETDEDSTRLFTIADLKRFFDVGGGGRERDRDKRQEVSGTI